MDANINMIFKVTPSQKETIDLRVEENGFDDISAYIKVVALKTHAFNISPAGSSTDEPTVELGFKVTEVQQTIIEDKMNESGSKDLASYLLYVALHGVVTAVIEVRSTGGLDSMLARIAASRGR